MRLTASLVVFAGAMLALGACNKSEPAPEPAASAAAAAEVPGGLAIDGLPNTGVFEVSDASGKKRITTTLADGTTTVVEDGKTKAGTWTSTGPGNYCSTFAGKTTCYKEEMINGVFTSTSENDPKEVATVKRVSTGLAPTPGTYEVFNADGSAASTTEIRADGGYTETPAKGLSKSGVVKMVDGKTCFDPSGKEEATCYLDGIRNPDGSFTATDPKGVVLTVKPKA